MPDGWDKWNDKESAYVDWWDRVDGQLPTNDRDFVPLGSDKLGSPFVMPWMLDILRENGGIEIRQEQAKDLADQYYAGGARVPVPKDSQNPDWADPKKRPPDWITDEVRKRLPDDIRKDTVIVAVIDTGVALGHRAFRRANGTTRVISAWQQTAEFRQQTQEYLPFGEEWYAGDIDAELLAHSRNRDPGDRLDEEGFNRALRLVEPQRIRGHRDLDHRAAHGTHVMDLAAGLDPRSEDAERLRLVVVNLPTQFLHGSAGNFLMYYAAYALNRVFDIAKALWEKNFPGEAGGFPVALSLAYGMMAGPKDGGNPLEKLIEKFVSERDKARLPTSICLPAGNENLARAVAHLGLAKNKFCDEIPWRTLPSDRTSNFVELWLRSPKKNLAGCLSRFAFKITAPNGEVFAFSGAQDNHYYNMQGVNARLYCSLYPDKSKPTAVQFVLATAPTLIVEPDAAVAPSPAGLWRIKVQSPVPASLSVFVQSDQSATVQSKAGLRSYLDHECYKPYLENGRPRDTFSYEPWSDEEPRDQDGNNPLVTRKGSHNALATTRFNSAIGGYCLSDGRPAPYSATCAVLRYTTTQQQIQAAYPTDDSPALYGLLAAGARDGSSVSFRGTSMAGAEATRRAAQAMLEWVKTGACGTSSPGSPDWHQQQASGDEACLQDKAKLYGKAHPTKIGSGRAKAPDPEKSHRWQHAPRRQIYPCPPE